MTNIVNVGDLKKFLQELENSWTEEEEKMLGSVNLIPIRISHYDDKGQFIGYGTVDLINDAYQLGLVFEQEKQREKS